MKIHCDVIIERTGPTLTAYRVGFNASDDSDYRCFVASAGDEQALRHKITAIYPDASHVVSVELMTFDRWLLRELSRRS